MQQGTRSHSADALALERNRVADYIALTKPELTFLSVVTALAGFLLAVDYPFGPLHLFHTLLGTALVGGSAGALNEYVERRYDAMMKRTEHRPLPSGRMQPGAALLFGVLTGVGGTVELALFVNPLTALLGAVTLVTYLFLYTPLKRITPLATPVGAVPGALPPLMGWAAATNGLSWEACWLFGILFFWQMPHFLSLAWMYRKDYARAGYKILTVLDQDGAKTAAHVLVYTVFLLLVSLLPTVAGLAGLFYGIFAFASGLGVVLLSIHMLYDRGSAPARRLFAASLVHLPLLMLVLVVDRQW